ncbi:MAG: PfkB family carbohydrate kinase, partial [Actinomycetota bacterium]|nr:PfkB family carbohydrate kinase [Actinomycetota bacterium]
MTRVAVVGHVEWVDFISLSRFPGEGQIAHAEGAITRAAGGGGVASAVLAEQGAEVDFFCALGADADGQAAAAQIAERDIGLHVAWRDQPTRRAITLLTGAGERTIVTIGERLEPRGADALPWDRVRGTDGAYFTAGDGNALRLTRARTRVLVASPRGRAALQDSETAIDALVFSAVDEDERVWAERLASRVDLLVATEGAAGGQWWGSSEGRWSAVSPPGQPHDSYGCGDSFAAGFTLGLARGASVAEAAGLG